MAIQASVVSHLNWFSAQVVCDTIHRTPAVYHINTYDKVEMIQSNLVSSNDLPPQERSCGHPIRQKDLQPNFSIQISLFLARRFKKKEEKVRYTIGKRCLVASALDIIHQNGETRAKSRVRQSVTGS